MKGKKIFAVNYQVVNSPKDNLVPVYEMLFRKVMEIEMKRYGKQI